MPQRSTAMARLFPVFWCFFFFRCSDTSSPKVLTFEETAQRLILNSTTTKQAYVYGPRALRALAIVDFELHQHLHSRLWGSDACGDNACDAWLADFESSALPIWRDPRAVPGFESYSETVKHGPVAVIAGHPIATFRMMRRFADEKLFPGTLRSLPAELQDALNVTATTVGLRHGWPTEQDLHDAVLSILRMQNVWGLRAADLAPGVIAGVKTGLELNHENVLTIGDLASQLGQYVLGLEWLQYARRLGADPERVKTAIRRLAEAHDAALAELNDGDTAPGDRQRFSFFAEPLSERFQGSGPPPKTMMAFDEEALRKQRRTEAAQELDFHELCRERTQARSDSLVCWIDRSTSPALAVYPARIEELSRDPPLLKIHSLVSARTATKIAELSPEREYVELYVPERAEREVASAKQIRSRTSANSLIPDNSDPAIRALSRRLEAVTGLNVVHPAGAADQLLVVSYATGGNFFLHHDAAPLRLDRLASVFIYLSDVLLGGQTAFPRLGVSVQPEAGSAILWYNLLPDGSPDERTVHGACPVILGHKLGANKIMSTRGNAGKAAAKCPAGYKTGAIE